jgi:hypothetical protein
MTILENVRRGVNAAPANDENGPPQKGNGQLPA